MCLEGMQITSEHGLYSSVGTDEKHGSKTSLGHRHLSALWARTDLSPWAPWRPPFLSPQGRGTEITYWLTGVKGQEYNLPTPPTV